MTTTPDPEDYEPDALASVPELVPDEEVFRGWLPKLEDSNDLLNYQAVRRHLDDLEKSTKEQMTRVKAFIKAGRARLEALSKEALDVARKKGGRTLLGTTYAMPVKKRLVIPSRGDELKAFLEWLGKEEELAKKPGEFVDYEPYATAAGKDRARLVFEDPKMSELPDGCDFVEERKVAVTKFHKTMGHDEFRKLPGTRAFFPSREQREAAARDLAENEESKEQ